ncbi:methyltransferase domain-containing protein [Congregibacter brevis]|uniref:Methyltransferase domain-containing protein n=1 Tax=Congregibacter brevis TaxID=3081201 RepID=A0ABZ0III1_9GAMM|nr:methyltransferase domain-containing protein [Congregibacter sp. IMCC45268]
MPFEFNTALRCPLDGLPMDWQDGVLHCANRHAYDIAKQGYANLLSAKDKRSKDPGDSHEMVAARHRFLEGGHYQAVANSVADVLLPHLVTGSLIVDAGCGEGYYLRHLRDRVAEAGLPSVAMVGFDISKWAVQVAARRFAATWLVASNRSIPLGDASTDAVIDMFGFPDFESFSRILKPSGLLLRVQAGRDHLIELRRLIYPSLKDRELSQSAPPGFSLQAQSQLNFETVGLDKTQMADLLLMTPHFFRASAEGKERAAAVDTMPVTVNVSVDLFRKS